MLRRKHAHLAEQLREVLLKNLVAKTTMVMYIREDLAVKNITMRLNVLEKTVMK
jgi:hypothetical protein